MASDHPRGVDSPADLIPDDLAASAPDEEGVLVADASANGVDGLLVELARRAAIASRLRSRTETAVLQSVLRVKGNLFMEGTLYKGTKAI
jgi:hypothetical protein